MKDIDITTRQQTFEEGDQVLAPVPVGLGKLAAQWERPSLPWRRSGLHLRGGLARQTQATTDNEYRPTQALDHAGSSGYDSILGRE